MRSHEMPFCGPNLPANETRADSALVMSALRHVELIQHHHDLDYIICALSDQPVYDELLVARLKKRKLQVKDEIARVGEFLNATGDAAARP